MRERAGLYRRMENNPGDIKDQKDVPQHASLISTETRALPRNFAATTHVARRAASEYRDR